MKPIRLPNDARTEAVRGFIDRCEFRKVRHYVESPNSEIRAAFAVDESIGLEQVAVVAANGDDMTMTQLMESRFVVRLDDFTRVPDDNPCRVIHIPPAYLVQFVRS